MTIATGKQTRSMQPWIPRDATHEAFTGFFPISPLKDAPSNPAHSRQNDFEKRVTKLLFTSPSPGYSSYFFSNLQEIGQIEGFEVVPSEPKFTVYPVRDPKLATAKGHVLEPTCSENLAKALDRSMNRHDHLRDHSASASDHPFFAHKCLGQVARGKLHRRTADRLPSGVQRDSRLYYEGGNCFLVTKDNNKPAYVIGDDSLTITHQALRLEGWFKDPGLAKLETQTSACVNERLLYAKYRAPVNQQLLDGQIPKLINKMAQSMSTSLTDPEIQSTLQEMHAMGLLTVVNFDSPSDKIKGREIATQYLAQREFVKQTIFPQELECDAEDITFLPQAAYHLDVFMTPGPNGFFVQDYRLAVNTLQQIKNNAKELNLTKSDLEQLETMIVTTTQIGIELTPLLDKVKENLMDAGFSVIPTPGAFFGHNPHHPMQKTQIINFLNCLTGFSPKTGHLYYIAAGTKTDGVLGDVLMNAYGEFLQSQCNNLAVYFAGRNPEEPTDFSEATKTMSELQVGPHCLSYELSVEKSSERKTDD